MAKSISVPDLKPTFWVQVDEERGELHFSTSGLFDQASMAEFITEVGNKVGPLLASKRRIRAFGDLSGYVTQTREIGKTMERTLTNAERAGIERTAIVINSAILKMQYKRVSEGRNVKIFENRDEALEWLRN